MLSVEEKQNSIKYSIELDHCYTSKLPPMQPKSANSSDIIVCSDINESSFDSSVSSTGINNSSTKQNVSVPPKIIKQAISTVRRARRASTIQQNNSTNLSTVQSEKPIKIHNENDIEEDKIFSSTESSESEESFSDSDFGPRPMKKSVRARGGRRGGGGLTTRGGSIVASRRRASNKQLDLELAATVSAIQTPKKEDKSEEYSINESKKQMKIFNTKSKIDEPVAAPVEANVLQTKNQVKANLINANMFEGSMILTKPEPNKNKKVLFIQKHSVVDSSERKTNFVGIKEHLTIPKSKLAISSYNSSPSTTKDGKSLFSSNFSEKETTLNLQAAAAPVIREIDKSVKEITELQKVELPVKSTVVKKEIKKPDAICDSSVKKTTTAISKPNVASKSPNSKSFIII